MTAAATLATSCGPFTVMVDGDIVVASGWTADPDLLLAPLAPGHKPTQWTWRSELGVVTDAVLAYFGGDLHAIDPIRVNQRSGPFIERAWKALRAVPPGAPVSYQALARAAGRPAAARAAGQACGINAVALFVPCHRAVRTDGSLGGFRWGVGVKRWLLAHEAGTIF